MKPRKTIEAHSWLLLLITVMAAACGGSGDGRQRGMPSMKPSFSITDKNPLGIYVAHQLVTIGFPKLDIEKNNKPFSSFFKKFTEYDYTRNNNLYAIISQQFYPNDDDVEAITDFVSHGNTLFIAANKFNSVFLDKFHLIANNPTAWKLEMGMGVKMEQTNVQLTDTVNFATAPPYGFFYYPQDGSIKREDSFPARLIVSAQDNVPGAVVFKYGSGRIIAVANATTFTNYFLLSNNNYNYLLQLLGYVPDNITDITWDTYYNSAAGKRGQGSNGGRFSSFQELMKHPALVWAFWLTLLGALLLIVMALIRRQRMVAIVKPNTNSSIEFGETVARLYLLKKDNKNIAQKMITYFLEQVRSKYYISTGTLNHEFAQLLAAKSGVGVEEAQMLLRTIDQIQNETNVSDYMLLDLNGQIQQFVK